MKESPLTPTTAGSKHDGIHGALPAAELTRDAALIDALRLSIPALRILDFDTSGSLLTVEQQAAFANEETRAAVVGAANLTGFVVIIRNQGEELFKAEPDEIPVLFQGLDSSEQARRLGRRDAQLLDSLLLGDTKSSDTSKVLGSLERLLARHTDLDVEFKCDAQPKVVVLIDDVLDIVAESRFTALLKDLNKWESEYNPYSLAVVIRPSPSTVERLVRESFAHASILSVTPDPSRNAIQVTSLAGPALDTLTALRARTGWQITCATAVDLVVEPRCPVANPSREALVETELCLRRTFEDVIPVDRTIFDRPHCAMRIIAPINHLSQDQLKTLVNEVPLRACRLEFTDARRSLTPHEIHAIVKRLEKFFPALHVEATIEADDSMIITATNNLAERIKPWYGEFLHTVERLLENAQSNVKFVETINEPTVSRAWDTLTKGKIRSQLRLNQEEGTIEIVCGARDLQEATRLAPLLHHSVGYRATISSGLPPLGELDQPVIPSTPISDGKLPTRNPKRISEVLPHFLPVQDVAVEHGIFVVRHRLGQLSHELLTYLASLLPAGRMVVFRPQPLTDTIKDSVPRGEDLLQLIERSVDREIVLHNHYVDSQGMLYCHFFGDPGRQSSAMARRSMIRAALGKTLGMEVSVTMEAIRPHYLRNLKNAPHAFRSVLARGVDAREQVISTPEQARQRLIEQQQLRVSHDWWLAKIQPRMALSPLNISLLSVDPGNTTLVEQAISLERHGALLRLGVHIFDPSDYLYGARVIERLLALGSSVYFNDPKELGAIHLVRRMPEFGFTTQGERPSLSLFITLNKHREIVHWDFARTLARLNKMLSIEQFNDCTADASHERALCDGMDTVFHALNRKFGPHLAGMPHDGAAATLTHQSAVVIGTLAGDFLKSRNVPYLQGVRMPRNQAKESELHTLANEWGAPVGSLLPWPDTLRALAEKFNGQRDLLEALACKTAYTYQASHSAGADGRPDASITAPLRRVSDTLTVMQVTEILQRGHPSAWLTAAVNRAVGVVNASNTLRRFLALELGKQLAP